MFSFQLLEVPYKFVQGAQTENKSQFNTIMEQCKFDCPAFNWLHKCDNHCIN